MHNIFDDASSKRSTCQSSFNEKNGGTNQSRFNLLLTLLQLNYWFSEESNLHSLVFMNRFHENPDPKLKVQISMEVFFHTTTIAVKEFSEDEII